MATIVDRYEKLPGDNVNFVASGVTLGNSIAAFFLKQGYSKVFMEFDCKNKTVSFEGTFSEEGIRIYTIRLRRALKIEWAFLLSTHTHRHIIDFSRRYLKFKAKKVGDNKVLVEDVPLLSKFNLSNFVIDLEQQKVIYRKGQKVNITDLKKVRGLSFTDKWIEKYKREKLSRPFIPTAPIIKKEQEVFQQSSRPVQVHPNVIRTEPKVQSLPQQIKTTAQKSIVNKEIGNIWGFETPPEKLPSKEERKMIDRINSKIILGE